MSGLKTIEQFILEFREVMQDPTIKISRDHVMRVSYQGEFEIVIKFSIEDNVMYLFSPIRSVENLNRNEGLNFVVNCMAANHFFVSTRGATLSYASDEKMVSLNYAQTLKATEALELLNIVAAFGDTSKVLRKWAESQKALMPNGASAIEMKRL